MNITSILIESDANSFTDKVGMTKRTSTSTVELLDHLVKSARSKSRRAHEVEPWLKLNTPTNACGAAGVHSGVRKGQYRKESVGRDTLRHCSDEPRVAIYRRGLSRGEGSSLFNFHLELWYCTLEVFSFQQCMLL